MTRPRSIPTLALLVLALLTPAGSAAGEGDVEFFPSPSGVAPAGLPFSEAVRVGHLVFLSGQVGVEPGTMTLVEGGIAAEAKQTMENIRATLEAIDLSMADVVKCTVMLEDISQWAAFNEVYRQFFERPYPARSAFGADGLALGAAIEVECWAAVPDEREP